MSRPAIILFLGCILFTSCATKKNLSYLAGNKPSGTVPIYQYTITAGDNLFIQIKTPDASASEFYNLNDHGERGSYNEAYVYLNSHAVAADGSITLPFIGAVPVAGHTLETIIPVLEQALSSHLKDASVFVKLVSYDVTVLGEVNHPGSYTAYTNQVTIFQALGLAGDLTNYGKRGNVKVVRQNSAGQPETYTLDLTRQDVFASPGYYVYPHDVIYVSPTKGRPLDINLRPMGVLLSGAALVLLILRTIN